MEFHQTSAVSTSDEFVRAEAWVELIETIEGVLRRNPPRDLQTAGEMEKSIKILKVAAYRWRLEAEIENGAELPVAIDFFPDH